MVSCRYLASNLTSCIKVTLCLLNLWVICVVLVVVLGHVRLFDTDLSLMNYEGAHLVVMRDLKVQDAERRTVEGIVPSNVSQEVTEKNKVPYKETLQLKSDGEAMLSPVQKEQISRVSTMRQWCERLKPRSLDPATIPTERLSGILVDHERNLLFCQIPGVALNDWKRMFIFLSGKLNVTSHLKISAYEAHSKYNNLIKRLSDFKPDERRKIVDESFKFMFVRDPLERLLSMFNNKFAAKYSRYFHETFGKRIVQRYRKNATAQALKTGNDVKFNEFVRFIVDSEHENIPLNEHWDRYYKQCHPCVIKYDYVGKFETLADDTKEVLFRAKVLNKIKPPFLADTFIYSEKVLKATYQTVSVADLKRLWKMYYPDYNLFSYPYPEILKNLFRTNFNDY